MLLEHPHDLAMIDVHASLGVVTDRDMPALDAEAMLAQMDRFGITAAVVGSTAAAAHSPARGNRELMAMIAGHPRLRPRWELLPSPAGEGAALDAVAAATDAGVEAFEMHPHRHGYALTSPDAAVVLNAVERSGRPLLIDREQSSWSGLEGLAAAHPALPIVVSAVGYRELRALAAALNRQPNLYVDMVNFSSHQGVEWISHALPGRLLFATGAPGRDAGETVTRLLMAGIDGDARVRIARSSALSLLPARAEAVA